MTIALIAHDSKKELMVQFCTAYCRILSHQLLFGVLRNECNRHPLPSPLPKRLERFCKKVLCLK